MSNEGAGKVSGAFDKASMSLGWSVFDESEGIALNRKLFNTLSDTTLELHEESLIPGQTYSVNFSVFAKSNLRVLSMSTILIPVAKMPHRGMCSVLPSTGLALVTNFFTDCHG